MSRYVRVGHLVLDPGRVKAARLEAADPEAADPHPELQVKLHAPPETVSVPAASAAEADAWLDELAACTGLQRIRQVLVRVRDVRLAVALPALRHRSRGQVTDRGPGVRLSLPRDRVDVPTATLDEARACLDELVRVMQGAAGAAPPGAAASTAAASTPEEEPWDTEVVDVLPEEPADFAEDPAEDARTPEGPPGA